MYANNNALLCSLLQTKAHRKLKFYLATHVGNKNSMKFELMKGKMSGIYYTVKQK